MKKLEYTKENLRLLSYLISKATSGSLFTKLLKDAGWTSEMTTSEAWQLSKKNKEEYLFDEFVKIGQLGRFDILDYIVEKVVSKDQIYFKVSEKEYRFPRQQFTTLKEKMGTVSETPRNTNLKLFNARKLHPAVIFLSKNLFRDGYYSQAIFESCKALDKRVQKDSGLQTNGKSLMSTAFSKNNPKIKLNNNQSQSDLDEQEGFMYIFMGVMQGVRNPKGHDVLNIKDPHRALDYLSLISLLLKRLDEVK
jgi:uncharacterized protein (TIGR02391 family)